MTHQISVRSDRKGINTPRLTALLRKTVRTVLLAEGVECPCEVNILLTDDEGIRQVNLAMRQIDKATDVLSFPMFTLTPGEHPTMDDADPEDERVALGDMCLSVEHARAQAEAYGHSYEQEMCYLCVHSVLHLLGYDHLDEGVMKRQMRAREKVMMDKLGMGE
jgi:probable rRNA maturation factor